MKKIILGIMMLFLMFITGCGGAPTLSQSAARIINADSKMTDGCQFLGDVHGVSGWGSLTASVGIENAKNVAREEAVSMGATHIVWTDMAGGPWPHANGKAYRCK